MFQLHTKRRSRHIEPPGFRADVVARRRQARSRRQVPLDGRRASVGRSCPSELEPTFSRSWRPRSVSDRRPRRRSARKRSAAPRSREPGSPRRHRPRITPQAFRARPPTTTNSTSRLGRRRSSSSKAGSSQSPRAEPVKRISLWLSRDALGEVDADRAAGVFSDAPNALGLVCGWSACLGMAWSAISTDATPAAKGYSAPSGALSTFWIAASTSGSVGFSCRVTLPPGPLTIIAMP